MKAPAPDPGDGLIRVALGKENGLQLCPGARCHRVRTGKGLERRHPIITIERGKHAADGVGLERPDLDVMIDAARPDQSMVEAVLVVGGNEDHKTMSGRQSIERLDEQMKRAQPLVLFLLLRARRGRRGGRGSACSFFGPRHREHVDILDRHECAIGNFAEQVADIGGGGHGAERPAEMRRHAVDQARLAGAGRTMKQKHDLIGNAAL